MAKIKTRTRREVYDLWIEALRSGEYRQGRGRLRNVTGTEFCCLGVLCDLAVKDGGQQWDAASYGPGFDGHSSNLSLNVQRFMGMTAKQQNRLMQLNDSLAYNKSFNEIADYIEKTIAVTNCRKA